MAEGDFSIKAIISADSSKFDKGIKNVGNSVKNTSSQIDSLTSKMKTAFAALGGLFAINKIKNFSSESIKAWKFQEKQLKILSSTLKTTGAEAWTSSKEIQNFASSLQKVTNYGDEAIISMQNVLLGFKNIQGDTFKEATKAILDMSTVMNMDLTSACQAVGKALDDPIQGIGALSRQGFRFSDEQKKLIKVLIDTGKTAEAQKIILDELKTTYGGASEASADIGEQLKNTWNDLKEQIGGAIAEITNKFAGSLKDIIEGIQNMSAHTKRFIGAFAKTAVAIGGLTTAVHVLKTALDALKAHPIILAISLAISGVSALIGLFSTANHELEDEAEDIRRLNEASKALFSTSEEEQKLSAQQVKELTKLYPELVGRIKENNTTVQQAVKLQQELNKEKTMSLFHKQKEELAKLDEGYQLIKKDIQNYKDEAKKVYSTRAQEQENYRARQKAMNDFNEQLKQKKKEIDAQIIEINASLENIGMRLDPKTRKLIEIEVVTNEPSIQAAEETVEKTYSEMDKKLLEQRLNSLGEWTEEYKRIQIQLLEMDRERELENELNEEERVKINKYYNNEILKIENEFKDSRIDYERGIIEKKQEFYEEGTKDYLDYQIQLLEKDRERELNSAKTEEQIFEINEYYNKKILSTTKKYNKEKFADINNALKKLAKDSFEELGKSLVEGGVNWNNYKIMVLNCIAEILEALAAQLAALAAVNFTAEKYDKAIAAGAGSAAAYVASGAVKALATNMQNAANSISNATSSLSEFRNELKKLLEGIKDPKTLVLGVNEILSTIKKLNRSIEITSSSRKNLKNVVATTQDELNKWHLSNAYKKYAGSRKGQYITTYIGLDKTQQEQYEESQAYIKFTNEINTYTKELTESYRALGDALSDYDRQIYAGIKENKSLIENYEELFTASSKYLEVQNELLNPRYSETFNTVKDYLNGMAQVYYYYQDILREYQLSIITSLKTSVYEDILNTGSEIGSSLIESITKGATKEDFMENIKDYMRTNLIKLLVYTEDFMDELSNVSVDMISAITTGKEIDSVISKISTIYDEAMEKAQEAEKIISRAFSETEDNVESSLTKLGKIIKDFKESISDLGGDLADTLINGLSDGLTQSDFLTSLKKWLRQMILQAVVYTESMKTEIERIGKIISDGLSNGFSEESLHTIRMELSFMYHKASEQMSNIDNILNSVFDGYATGTQSASRGIHLVGEQGPELVKFRGGEQVINAQNTKEQLGLVGNKSNIFNVNFYQTKDTSAFNMIQQLKQYNRQMAMDGII